MVDASEHLKRPSPWLVPGADLVIYGGGKFLRGPQTSGLLLGSKRLVEAAWRNASQQPGLGPADEVSKEDIIGVLPAIEYWFEERDQAAERQKWYDDLAVITERVGRMPGAHGEVIEPVVSMYSTASPDHARRQFGNRGLDRDRPVPAAARRSGASGRCHRGGIA